ncbi:MAG: hypothetical protein ABMA15_12215 [Vicinamibacterales bacterium]
MRLTAGLTLSAAVGLSALVFGQAPPPRSAAATTGVRFVAIGCLSQQGTGTARRYVITDRRGSAPTVYRLTGDTATLAPHVGHTMEAWGTLAASTSAGPNALTVNSLVWIASTCTK